MIYSKTCILNNKFYMQKKKLIKKEHAVLYKIKTQKKHYGKHVVIFAF